MSWYLSHRGDRRALPIADRHYNRQKVGSPQFVPPGRCLVLLTKDATDLWVTSFPFAPYVKHAWAGAYVCSCFRKESSGIASEMIREAVAHTLWFHAVTASWQFAISKSWAAYSVPDKGMITFIDPRKVRPTIRHGIPTWGYSYLKAGFRYVGQTKGGLLAFQLLPSDMPIPQPPAILKGELFDLCG